MHTVAFPLSSYCFESHLFVSLMDFHSSEVCEGKYLSIVAY